MVALWPLRKEVLLQNLDTVTLLAALANFCTAERTSSAEETGHTFLSICIFGFLSLRDGFQKALDICITGPADMC